MSTHIQHSSHHFPIFELCLKLLYKVLLQPNFLESCLACQKKFKVQNLDYYIFVKKKRFLTITIIIICFVKKIYSILYIKRIHSFGLTFSISLNKCVYKNVILLILSKTIKIYIIVVILFVSLKIYVI